ncbi:MAG TPA: AI-2E family transporter, partial [Ktedonobacteraceae bacterium]|nr:AI-2E family transporter [Ktedonobacteraceae bacterium]
PNASTPAPFSRSVWFRRLIIALTILAWMAIGAVVLMVAQRMIGTLILLIAAALLANLLYPLVRFLQRFMPRFLAIIVVYLVAVGALSFLLYNMVASVIQQFTSFVFYFQYLLSPQGQSQLQPIVETLQKLGISQDQLTTFGQQVVNQLQGLITQVIPVLSGIMNFLMSAIIIAVLSIYFLLDGRRIVYWLRHKTPIAQRDTITFLLITINQTVGGYFRGLLILATIAGVSTGIVLALLGVPYALLLAVIVFIFLFIPVIGGVISGSLCIMLSLPQGWVTALIVTIFVIVLQQVVIGQILTPRILGDAVKIHPIVAILALFAGTELLGMGLLGGFLAVPLAGILQAVLIAYWHRWQATHPEQFPADVTGGQPHQPLETDKHSEECIKEDSLSQGQAR